MTTPAQPLTFREHLARLAVELRMQHDDEAAAWAMMIDGLLAGDGADRLEADMAELGLDTIYEDMPFYLDIAGYDAANHPASTVQALLSNVLFSGFSVGGFMAEIPVRSFIVTVPLETYEALAAQAATYEEAVEERATTMLVEAMHLGTPGEMRAAAQLATETADLLSSRWQQRRSQLTQLRTDLLRIAADLARLTSGA
jgi:hypothetical protein